MRSDDAANLMRIRAHTFSRALFLRLHGLSERHSSGPLELIDTLKEAVRLTDQWIENAKSVGAIQNGQIVLNKLATGALPIIEDSYSDPIQRGVFLILREIAQALDSGSPELLVVPRIHEGYTISDLSDDIAPIEHVCKPKKRKSGSSEWEQFRPKGEIRVVSYPKLARQDVLLHAIFGHELGHQIASEFIQEEKLDRRFISDLATSLNLLRKEGLGQAELNQANQKLIRIWFRGLEELISDAVAVRIFGASAILAAWDQFIFDPWDHGPQLPNYYPSHRLRLSLMLQELINMGHLETLRKIRLSDIAHPFLAALNSSIDDLGKKTGPPRDNWNKSGTSVEELAYSWIHRVWPRALEFIRNRTKRAEFGLEMLRNQLGDCIERIALDIPPNEVGLFPHTVPADWRVAYLAGWAHDSLNKRDKSTQWEAKIQRRTKINELVLKAIEDGFLRKEYRSYLKKKGGKNGGSRTK